MNALLLWSLLVAGACGSPADTTVEARRGDRVVVERLTGQLVVEAWGRAAVSVGGETEEDVRVEVVRSGRVLSLRPVDPKRRNLSADVVLRVPGWMDLTIEARTLDVQVRGVEGEVSVRTISGDLSVQGAARSVDLSTVEGEVEVRGARGTVRAHSTNDDVRVYDVRGDVDARTVDGDLILEGVRAPGLYAETIDGDVLFRGTLLPEGTYTISTHDGDAVVELPPDTDARVSVSTFDGDFSSDFPVTVQRYGGGGVFDFTLGRGSARLEIKVFDGEIRLQSSRSR